MQRLDAVVVGSGPNGLAAAVVLAEAGLSVKIFEASASVGGGCRTAALTLPGFAHDVCSAAHPLALASPFFRRFGLEGRGVRLLQPELPFAHPLDGGRAACVYRSVEATAQDLGADGPAYRQLMEPLVGAAGAIADAGLSSYRSLPRSPLSVARFAWSGVRPAVMVARRFETPGARALIAGVAAHSMRPLDRPLTGGVGLLLGLLAHAVGWPVVEGGSAGITAAMVRALEKHGAEIATGELVTSLAALPPARAVLLDVSPAGLLGLADGRLRARDARTLRRYRYGPGVCKVDWALDGPVPWQAAECRKAGTLHLGGTLEEVAAAETDVARGRHPERPYVLAVQPGVADPTRAPPGKHTLWAYCHVPAGSDRDMRPEIARQVERFAPGFQDLVLSVSVRTAKTLERENPNYVGGDIATGVQDLRQTLLRPAARLNPYRTPLEGVYLCSAATPPGPGVHGRCGELAARSVLREVFGIRAAGPGPASRDGLVQGSGS